MRRDFRAARSAVTSSFVYQTVLLFFTNASWFSCLGRRVDTCQQKRYTHEATSVTRLLSQIGSKYVLSSILILLAAFFLWALVHSSLASFASKAWAQRTFGASADRWYRLAYNLLALLTLLPVLALVGFLPDRGIYALPAPWSWLMRGVQGLALLGLGAAFLQTGLVHFLGLEQRQTGRAAETGSLSVHGFYCRVRHPLYFFGIVLVWTTPVMTANWLAACLMVTTYFYLGARHEEQRLLAEFGPSYVEYSRKVPMLLPRPGRCVQPTTGPTATRSPAAQG